MYSRRASALDRQGASIVERAMACNEDLSHYDRALSVLDGHQEVHDAVAAIDHLADRAKRVYNSLLRTHATTESRAQIRQTLLSEQAALRQALYSLQVVFSGRLPEYTRTTISYLAKHDDS